eukprot:gene13557-20715_t
MAAIPWFEPVLAFLLHATQIEYAGILAPLLSAFLFVTVFYGSVANGSCIAWKTNTACNADTTNTTRPIAEVCVGRQSRMIDLKSPASAAFGPGTPPFGPGPCKSLQTKVFFCGTGYVQQWDNVNPEQCNRSARARIGSSSLGWFRVTACLILVSLGTVATASCGGVAFDVLNGVYPFTSTLVTIAQESA